MEHGIAGRALPTIMASQAVARMMRSLFGRSGDGNQATETP